MMFGISDLGFLFVTIFRLAKHSYIIYNYGWMIESWIVWHFTHFHPNHKSALCPNMRKLWVLFVAFALAAVASSCLDLSVKQTQKWIQATFAHHQLGGSFYTTLISEAKHTSTARVELLTSSPPTPPFSAASVSGRSTSSVS